MSEIQELILTNDDLVRINKMTENEGFDEIMKYYNIFYQKYKTFNFSKNFITETKLLLPFFLNSLENAIKEEEKDKEIVEKMESIIHDIKFVLSEIDNLNINLPTQKFVKGLEKIFNFFEQENINTIVKEVQEFISDVLDKKKFNQESLDKVKKFNNDCYTLLKSYNPQTE